MKVAITGDSYGIGAALRYRFELEGHTVVGFSRSNGYDISNSEDRQRIITESQDCDLFINNAYATYSQCDLLFELWESWQQKHKRIINISSSIVMRWQHDFRDIKYRNAKIALEDASEFLWNKSQWPSIMVVRPCLTDTPAAKQNNKPGKVDTFDFADHLYKNVNTSLPFSVQVLALAVKAQ
jgi:NAD(P)-dependent dehydrogenase (short-subunit alcohol dehydrogenase family)